MPARNLVKSGSDNETMAWVILPWLLALTASGVSAAEEPRDTALRTRIDPFVLDEGSYRLPGLAPGGEHLFTVWTVPLNLVAVEVTGSGSPPRLELLEPRACDQPGILVEQLPSLLVLASEVSGSYCFRVACQDPAGIVENLQLHVLRWPLGRGTTRQEEGEDEEEPPDEEPLSEILPILAPIVPKGDFCAPLIADDHGDSLLCASSLSIGLPRIGEIGNAFGNDRDVFGFEQRQQRTVMITSAGSADTAVALYDARGLALAMDDDSGAQQGARIVLTLPPGHYFVVVSGSLGSEGEYRLKVTAPTS